MCSNKNYYISYIYLISQNNLGKFLNYLEVHLKNNVVLINVYRILKSLFSQKPNGVTFFALCSIFLKQDDKIPFAKCEITLTV